MHRTARPTVKCVSRRENIAIDHDNPSVRFDSLSPDFADRFGAEHRWANVVELTDWSHKNRLATVFPSNFRNPAVPQFRTGGDTVLATTEGLVTFPRFKEIPNHWTLTEGSDAIVHWLKSHGIEAAPSDAGRATTQIIQTLGGFMGTRSVAVKGVVTLLDEMARTPITRSAHQQEFENKINVAVRDGLDIFRGNVYQSLIERNAVQLGLELKCSKCAQWSWYSIAELSYSNHCALCLRPFPFPVGNPRSSKLARWAYRVIGPFALPNYAKGGYAAALALRFLGEVVGHGHSVKCTWAAGQELVHAGKEALEADFILWFQRTQMLGPAHPTELVFGEAKSFGKEAFEDADFQRMRRLAELFPGAVLVFATMKEAEEFSRSELRQLRAIAEWGREYDRALQKVRAPVVVLTGTELFTPAFFEEAWRKKGGRRQQLVSHYVREEDLQTLADLTQQAYLGLPSRGNWLHAKAAKRAARAERRKAKKSDK